MQRQRLVRVLSYGCKVKNLLKFAAKSLGFEIRRSHQGVMRRQMPVELSDDERQIIEDVMDNNLTLVSYERLWATLLACKYVVSQNI